MVMCHATCEDSWPATCIEVLRVAAELRSTPYIIETDKTIPLRCIANGDLVDSSEIFQRQLGDCKGSKIKPFTRTCVIIIPLKFATMRLGVVDLGIATVPR